MQCKQSCVNYHNDNFNYNDYVVKLNDKLVNNFLLWISMSSCLPLIASVQITDMASVTSVLGEFNRFHHETLEDGFIHSGQCQSAIVLSHSCNTQQQQQLFT